MTTLSDRFTGCLLGLACGDAVGTTFEFRAPGTFAPLTDMVGGGPFDLEPGQWTDDTSMALCLAESLLYRGGFDARDQMDRYVAWWQRGYLSSTGTCFDIGNTVRNALDSYRVTGDPIAGSTDALSAGNGSIMRLAPVVLFYYPDRDAIQRFSAESSLTTHGAPEAVDCCRLLGDMLFRALEGAANDDVLSARPEGLTSPNVIAIAEGTWRAKERVEICGTGYSVASLEAVAWCFAQGHDFESTVLLAANLGDDADTTAAIAGQLAGAFYGVRSIPAHWLEKLHMRDEIERIAVRLGEAILERSA